MIRSFLIFSLFFVSSSLRAANWPDGPWVNRAPSTSAALSVVAFVSPYDLQFYQTENLFKKLNRHYSSLNLNFILVATGELGLPFSDGLIKTLVSETAYDLPVLLDGNQSFSKSWRAYSLPTFMIFSSDGKATSFDPGVFDPVSVEKTLQKLLKESFSSNTPNRLFTNESEFKNCGHPHTYFVGEKFGKAWSPNVVKLTGDWQVYSLWMDGPARGIAVLELVQNKLGVGILAESAISETSSRMQIFYNNSKVPSQFRGSALSEDKSGSTFATIKSLRMMPLISHADKMSEENFDLRLVSDNKNMRIRAVQTLPSCLEIN